MDKDWKINITRHPTGRIDRLELVEGGPSPSDSGPTKIVRKLIFEREGKFWRVSITGPRGGLQLDGVFSGGALLDVIQRLQGEVDR